MSRLSNLAEESNLLPTLRFGGRLEPRFRIISDSIFRESRMVPASVASRKKMARARRSMNALGGDVARGVRYPTRRPGTPSWSPLSPDLEIPVQGAALLLSARVHRNAQQHPGGEEPSTGRLAWRAARSVAKAATHGGAPRYEPERRHRLCARFDTVRCTTDPSRPVSSMPGRVGRPPRIPIDSRVKAIDLDR